MRSVTIQFAISFGDANKSLLQIQKDLQVLYYQLIPEIHVQKDYNQVINRVFLVSGSSGIFVLIKDTNSFPRITVGISGSGKYR